MGKITIDQDEYDSLVAHSELLNALLDAGVDNWPGYDYAMETLREAR